MKFMDSIKRLWQKQTYQSQQLIKQLPKLKDKNSFPMEIEYKIHLNAEKITSDQEVIDRIANQIIEEDVAKRKYAGKSDQDLKTYHDKIYKYESFLTQDVKLVPNDVNHLDVYVNQILLGHLPDEYTVDVLHFLQSTIVMAFAYIKGGPYKTYDAATDSVVKKSEPFDLNLYIQFS